MKFIFSLSVLSINLLVQQILLPQVLSCKVYSKIDTISYIDYKGIEFVLTSNRYYYIIRTEDITKRDVKQFEISGEIPYLTDCCDSSFYKELNDCDDENQNQHSIVFIKRISGGQTNYISLDIKSLTSEDKNYLWSQPESIRSDLILSNLNIDYSKPIDASFHTDNHGEIYFIQGEFYAGIEFQVPCPQKKDIKIYDKRRLSDLNVFGRVNSAYYEIDVDMKHILYLTNYEKQQYFRVEIDSQNSKEGKLVSVKTTTEPISSHPIFSRICAQDHNFNSSHLSADESTNGTDRWTVTSYSASIICLISLTTLIFILI